MRRRRRVILWCSLAALSASAYALSPLFLGFDRVEATVTRGDSYNAISWEEPIDFRYRVGRATYEVRGANVPQSLYLSWDGGPSSSLPVYCNRWFPRWWRWEELPLGVRQRCEALIGLALV